MVLDHPLQSGFGTEVCASTRGSTDAEGRRLCSWWGPAPRAASEVNACMHQCVCCHACWQRVLYTLHLVQQPSGAFRRCHDCPACSKQGSCWRDQNHRLTAHQRLHVALCEAKLFSRKCITHVPVRPRLDAQVSSLCVTGRVARCW